MAPSGNLRLGLFGSIAHFSRTYIVGHPRQLAVGFHTLGTRSSTGNGNISSARYHGRPRNGHTKLNSLRGSSVNLSGTTPPFNLSWARKISTSSTSDHARSSYGTGTIRDLFANAFSPEGSGWTPEYEQPCLPVSDIKIVSWNVDFMAPEPADRVSCILDHLKTVILTNSSQPTIILLQELKEASFEAILKNHWVREHFAVAPPNTGFWPGRYGLATLISRHIPIQKAQMLQFHETRMGRTALFVDVLLQTEDASSEQPTSRSVRIANTHLESLGEGEQARAVQLSAIAAMLRQSGIHAGIVGGDMNMILPADQGIHVAAGLHDAGTDGPKANTWGYQSRKRAWQAKRLDRVFYTPTPGLVVEPMEVVGKGVKTERGEWASDHYAIQTSIALRGEDKS
ncbi:hypothetical protein V8D89_000062 [Ganoderma adspersum]